MQLIFQAVWKGVVGVRLWSGERYVVTERRRDILRQDIKVELGGVNGHKVSAQTAMDCLNDLIRDLKKSNPGLEFGTPTLQFEGADGPPSPSLSLH